MQQPQSTAAANTNTTKLPGYQVSFGMARINMADLIKTKEIDEKYFKPDSVGNIPARKMDSDELRALVAELKEKDPAMVIKLFTTKNEKTGQLIAHYPEAGVLNVMKHSLEKLPENYKQKGKDALSAIYQTTDKLGRLPIHTIDNVLDLATIKDSIALDTFKESLLKQDKENGQIPSHVWGSSKMNAYILEKFTNDKDFLENMFSIEDSYGDETYLRGAADTFEWCRVFKDDVDILKQKFMTENVDKEWVATDFVNHWSDDESGNDCIDALHNSLKDSHPEILKDIYTMEDGDGHKLSERVLDKKYFADKVMNLIVDSDLSSEDSLKLLQDNKVLLQNNNVENLDLVEKYLQNQVS